MPFAGRYLKNFTPPLSWYLSPPGDGRSWDTPFSPVGSNIVWQFVYAGYFTITGGLGGYPITSFSGTVEPKPSWWHQGVSWPGMEDVGHAPGYYQSLYWPPIPGGYQPPYDLIACAGAYDPSFIHGGSPGYGWMSFDDGDPYVSLTTYVFWPRVLDERPEEKPYTSIIPIFTGLTTLLLPVIAANSIDAIASAARRRRKT